MLVFPHYINVIFQHNTSLVKNMHVSFSTLALRHFTCRKMNKAGEILVCVCGVGEGTNTQQNRKKCFELYIPAISDKLREGFVINHRHAALPTERIAWWAAA